MNNQNFHHNYSRYYDLLYREKDYAGEAKYVSSLIKKKLPGASSILELGCGTANHAIHLINEGFTITGLERSADMVKIAQEKNIPNLTVIEGDITSFSLPGQFDVAISLFHVISYLNENKPLVTCFQKANEHIAKGGLFIFDVWYTPAVYTQRPETRIKKIEDSALDIFRLAVPIIHNDQNIVDVNYEIIIRDKKTTETEIYKEKHPMRHFSIPEMDLLASQTGFQLIGAEEFLTGHQPSDATWGVCFVLQKN